MTLVMILVATLTPLVIACIVLAGRCWRCWTTRAALMTPITRQHFEVMQTGDLNERELESAKRRFRVLFERGGESAAEAVVQPGLLFLYQVRALAEIGTDAAGRILERQLGRRLSSNQLEQACYWIDLAAGLRMMNRQESLPYLLRCSSAALDSPLGHYFAAETVCLMGFAGYLGEPETPLGRSALRVLHRVVEGMRYGVPPAVIVEARLGEMIEAAWDGRSTDDWHDDACTALRARVVHESLRLLRRAPHLRAVFGEEAAERETLEWQLSRIAALEDPFRAWMKDAPPILLSRLASARGDELADVLHALCDLRVDAAAEVLSRLRQPVSEHRDLMINALRWSRDARVGDWLRQHAQAHVALEKRARRRRQAEPPRWPSVADEVGYRNVLQSLRGHPSVETERLLILACQDWDPLFRLAALGSLGWWEPFLRDEVKACLGACRRDPSDEVRQASRAALARLGERASLHWFRQALLASNPQQVAEAAHVIANEGLTLLWPELDRLLDAESAEVSLHAREAVERLSEEMESSV